MAQLQGQVSQGPPSFREQVIGADPEAWEGAPLQVKNRLGDIFFNKHYAGTTEWKTLTPEQQNQIRLEFNKTNNLGYLEPKNPLQAANIGLGALDLAASQFFAPAENALTFGGTGLINPEQDQAKQYQRQYPGIETDPGLLGEAYRGRFSQDFSAPRVAGEFAGGFGGIKNVAGGLAQTAIRNAPAFAQRAAALGTYSGIRNTADVIGGLQTPLEAAGNTVAQTVLAPLQGISRLKNVGIQALAGLLSGSVSSGLSDVTRGQPIDMQRLQAMALQNAAIGGAAGAALHPGSRPLEAPAPKRFPKGQYNFTQDAPGFGAAKFVTGAPIDRMTQDVARALTQVQQLPAKQRGPAIQKLRAQLAQRLPQIANNPEGILRAQAIMQHLDQTIQSSAREARGTGAIEKAATQVDTAGRIQLLTQKETLRAQYNAYNNALRKTTDVANNEQMPQPVRENAKRLEGYIRQQAQAVKQTLDSLEPPRVPTRQPRAAAPVEKKAPAKGQQPSQEGALSKGPETPQPEETSPQRKPLKGNAQEIVRPKKAEPPPDYRKKAAQELNDPLIEKLPKAGSQTTQEKLAVARRAQDQNKQAIIEYEAEGGKSGKGGESLNAKYRFKYDSIYEIGITKDGRPFFRSITAEGQPAYRLVDATDTSKSRVVSIMLTDEPAPFKAMETEEGWRYLTRNPKTGEYENPQPIASKAGRGPGLMSNEAQTLLGKIEQRAQDLESIVLRAKKGQPVQIGEITQAAEGSSLKDLEKALGELPEEQRKAIYKKLMDKDC